MKKILFSLLAAAAITACTKSGIEYDQPDEIGFVPVAKQKKVLEDLKEGKIDILFGTHRILNDQIKFKD